MLELDVVADTELLDELAVLLDVALLGDAELAGHSWSTFLSRGLPRLRRVRGLPFPSVLGSHGSGPWEPKANSAAVLAARPV